MILRARRIERLEEHPNLRGILGILAQLVHTTDTELVSLAAAWRNSGYLAAARDKALSPDSPLIVEVLAAFDALSAIYADDLTGAEYVTVEPTIAATALRAMRDAVAASYSRPILGRAEYAALMRPWRTVYPRARSHEPDLGPAAADVKRVLAALPVLAGRCHDPDSLEVFDGLLVSALTRDDSAHQMAMDAAFASAVVTGRRRVWTLVRRSAAEGFWRLCPYCRGHRGTDSSEDRRVMELCADLACALLVEDLLDTDQFTRLTSPLHTLIPLQHRRGR
ncbi:hypothetical protein ThrDRAFT_02388 [Frankia casuarinae]|uniref:Uncharacterized protein n=1 Tax=Frankia casuarinae (strain DSM 45818 / CECT 9043 / HFP020203 / CcI3) TaxID=106370 RepID=Q2J8H7_FRACC|nr:MULTISPECIES: hypothetical protein [Frankia]ABD12415.1 hypothetical protein Francci3_3058 [Frankia casuarinae]ETA01500.1 hypothetical protein CcI6DRAFT_03115 [Frankia sp. CcI6]EYT92006.1 hypothetical protein ThrDRAFT_02388 [Frankia casuarinae]KDA44763.1 hypothetical protein BMG523Draft_00284 [Frankia sp. BMG5.23]OAA22856.1 hypothetical protein AAY23_105916 [Frankia casuarinae]